LEWLAEVSNLVLALSYFDCRDAVPPFALGGEQSKIESAGVCCKNSSTHPADAPKFAADRLQRVLKKSM
jgi:hypothetical protein